MKDIVLYFFYSLLLVDHSYSMESESPPTNKAALTLPESEGLVLRETTSGNPMISSWDTLDEPGYPLLKILNQKKEDDDLYTLNPLFSSSTNKAALTLPESEGLVLRETTSGNPIISSWDTLDEPGYPLLKILNQKKEDGDLYTFNPLFSSYRKNNYPLIQQALSH